jgi:hypothetical protein
MRRIFLSLLIWLAAVGAAFAQAALLPDGKQQYFDNNGNPLAAGTIDFYIPATTTPKTTWQDSGQVTPNANPVVLDSAGRAIIYGAGVYRMLVKDSLGNTIYDALTTGQTATNVIGGATAGGSANAKTLTLTGYTNTNGAMACFVNNSINTAAVTLNINSQGALAVRSSNVIGDLYSGSLIANYYYCVVYNSTLTQYDLINSPSFVSPGVVATTGVTTIPATAGNGVIYTGDATSATYAITLPSAATWGTGKTLTIQKIDSSTNTVQVTPAGAELIDTIYDRVDLWSFGDTIRLQSTGSGWTSVHRSIKTYTELVTATTVSYAVKRGVRIIRARFIGGGGGGGTSAGCSTAGRICAGTGGSSGQVWDVTLDWQAMLKNTPAANTLSLTRGAGGAAAGGDGGSSILSWNASAISYTARGGRGGSIGTDTGAALVTGVPITNFVQTAPTTIAGLIIANWWNQSTYGGLGLNSGTSANGGIGGNGGSSFLFGGGGNWLRADSTGDPADAQSYGAAGGGGMSQAAAANRNGGQGTDGAFIIEQIF